MDGIVLLIILGSAAVAAFAYLHHRRRREYLMKKYKDEHIVKDIMTKRIWQGMSKDQLIDSWGSPLIGIIGF